MADSTTEIAEKPEKPHTGGRRYVPRFISKEPAEGQEISSVELKGDPTEVSRLVEVWERRFDNPYGHTASPVELTIPGMAVRWINTAIEGRMHRAKYDQGWEPVPVRLLKNPEEIIDLQPSPEGYVTRGERGREVLCMMPMDVFTKIQLRKSELNRKSYRPAMLREDMIQRAASRYGDETAEEGTRLTGTVTFGTERVTLADHEP